MKLDPFSSPYSRDPATTWRRLNATATSVSYDDDLKVWLIAGHDNVRTVLSDTTDISNAATMLPITALTTEAGDILAGLDAPAVAVAADRPYHLRTRAILRALMPTTAVHAERLWGPLVAARTDDIITGMNADEPTDLMHFAVQLPLLIIHEVLGLPATDAEQIRAWTDDFAELVWGNPTPEAQIAHAHSSVALWRHCADIVSSRADSGDYGSGLIGELLRYRNNDDSNLTVAEVAALALNVIAIGWTTTAGAIGNALAHGLADPARWTLLADDEHYLNLHVEETLRHSPAIDGWLRLTTTDVTLDGVTIPAGSRCLALIGAANHDPTVYNEPEVFDPRRGRAGQHLAFGAGPHHCIGAALARLELTTALRALARRLPDLALTAGFQQQFKPSAALRRLVSLPVQQQPARRCPVIHDNSAGPRVPR
ncbi:cytochrome P450 [Actinoplanes sp. NBRC 103695]|uniref:cytochrome P450 n=1 Tax=Actinoplanes sp. NBRC 103695 TaxID=3032202 RepID=UPI0024A18C7A|nr:cytochrome P450 [Actinoplanes sp. NBRC 103695]GLZ00841.1 cytochrome P450 [Actinoplanes sp. NBRC 103695]